MASTDSEATALAQQPLTPEMLRYLEHVRVMQMDNRIVNRRVGGLEVLLVTSV